MDIKLILWASQVDFHAIDLKDTTLPTHTDLVAVEQLHLPCTLIVVVLNRDAPFPLLDFPALGPQFDVDGVRTVEHQTRCADMNTLHDEN